MINSFKFIDATQPVNNLNNNTAILTEVSNQNPSDIVGVKYVLGEITKEEFMEKVAVL